MASPFDTYSVTAEHLSTLKAAFRKFATAILSSCDLSDTVANNAKTILELGITLQNETKVVPWFEAYYTTAYSFMDAVSRRPYRDVAMMIDTRDEDINVTTYLMLLPFVLRDILNLSKFCPTDKLMMHLRTLNIELIGDIYQELIKEEQTSSEDDKLLRLAVANSVPI